MYRNNVTLFLFVILTVGMFFILTVIFGDEPNDEGIKIIKTLKSENAILKKSNQSLKKAIEAMDITNASHLRQDSLLKAQLDENETKIDSLMHYQIPDFGGYGSDKLLRYFSNIH